MDLEIYHTLLLLAFVITGGRIIYKNDGGVRLTIPYLGMMVSLWFLIDEKVPMWEDKILTVAFFTVLFMGSRMLMNLVKKEGM